ncbi:MAG: hypothetical protein HQ517_10980, partial [SAR324 cluster bacterium]|nr:hypothetical protein [SAR324 cluster bacterium]
SIIVFLFCSFSTAPAFENARPGYRGLFWGCSFPLIEKHYPKVKFIEEDNFHVVIFNLENPEKEILKSELKLFEEQLYAVAHYYDGTLKPYKNRRYIDQYLNNLSKVKDIRYNTSIDMRGESQVTIWEFDKVLVLFKEYPPQNPTENKRVENSIHFVHKPIFELAMRYRKKHLGEPFNDVEDPDYISY